MIKEYFKNIRIPAFDLSRSEIDRMLRVNLSLTYSDVDLNNFKYFKRDGYYECLSIKRGVWLSDDDPKELKKVLDYLEPLQRL